jgi:hypothetical protein
MTEPSSLKYFYRSAKTDWIQQIVMGGKVRGEGVLKMPSQPTMANKMSMVERTASGNSSFEVRRCLF